MGATKMSALAVTLAALFAGACNTSGAARGSITIRYSHFAPEDLTARAGQPITITVRNDDPIDHEWIVGAAAVHERHRTGTDAVHDQVPTEVSVPALSTRTTLIVFSEPGDYQYICHLPGHEQYGMVGTLHVTAG